MRRLVGLAVVLFALSAPAFAAADPPAATPPEKCAERTLSSTGAIQLAQSSCRGRCSSSRGYCLSTCRDRQCRAICNDRYQSCLDSCRR